MGAAIVFSRSAGALDLSRSISSRIAAIGAVGLEIVGAGDFVALKEEVLSMTKDEQIKMLVGALGFYARDVAWNGPNQRNDGTDRYTPAPEPYIQDATRDGGAVARAALRQCGVTHIFSSSAAAQPQAALIPPPKGER